MIKGRVKLGRITITSPWTDNKYIIRDLDPAILTIFAKPEPLEVKNLRLKIREIEEDIVRERKIQEEREEKDQSKINLLETERNVYIEKLNGLLKPDEQEIENRFKIVKYGLVEPKISTFDDYLNLGKDATFIYSNIIVLSQVPENYAEVIEGLFREGKYASIKSDKSG